MDGTDNQKDILPEKGQSPAGEGQGTSTEEARTYTKEEVQKAINDALAAKGREHKKLVEWEANLKSQEEALKAAKAEIEEWRRQREEAELEEARTDPDKMLEYQRKQAEKRRLSELQTREAELKKQMEDFKRQKMEHEEEIKIARNTMMEIKIWQIGAKYGVDPAVLKELNLDSIEKIEAVAKRLGSIPKQVEEKSKTFVPDSGVTAGTYRTLTPEQFDKLPIEEKAKYLKKSS